MTAQRLFKDRIFMFFDRILILFNRILNPGSRFDSVSAVIYKSLDNRSRRGGWL